MVEGFGVTRKKRERALRKLAPVRLEDGLQPYMACFWFLHRGRQYSGFGYPCGLPLSEVRGFLDEYEISGEERRRFIRFVHALDSRFLELSSEKLKSNKDKDKKSNGQAERDNRRQSCEIG